MKELFFLKLQIGYTYKSKLQGRNPKQILYLQMTNI